MAEPHWSSYVGMVTGVVGLIASIVLGVVGHHRTKKIRELELRLELRKATSKVASDLLALKELLPYVKKSHHAVASAIGATRSGAMIKWEQTYKEDTMYFDGLLNSVPSPTDDFTTLDLAALENKSAEVHKLQLEVDKLTAKYKAVVSADDDERARLRNAHNRWQNTP